MVKRLVTGYRLDASFRRVEAAIRGTSAATAGKKKEGIGTGAARNRGYFEDRRLDDIF